ncbi:MAG: response regulator [Desulfobacterales bacterium]|nr:response regulator [Desulfobacterales bacterium]
MALDPQMKILIVEDFKASRKMEIEILKKAGFGNVIEAENGETAIEILKKEKDVKLIISDWNMPGKDGYELLIWVRSDDSYQEIPFIMATAQAEKKEAYKAVKAGVSNFISKPFTPEELKLVIDDTFGVSKESNDAPRETKLPRKTASGKIRLSVGHIQITDHLVLGALSYLISSGNFKPKYFELETRCMSGWNPVQKALETGEIDAALILAPIAMDLFSVGVPIRLVLFAHKNGSICVKSKKVTTRESFRRSFRNKTFYIPHVLSVHHMLSNMFFHEIGLKGGLVGKEAVDVTFEVIPPVKMPEFIARSPEACGFMVAQPVGAKAIAEGGADLLFLSGELWEYHPCCVVAMQQDYINAYNDAVHEFVDMLVQAGIFITQNPEISALIAIKFLDPDKSLKLRGAVLENVLTEPHGIKTDDLFPIIEDLDKMQRYMTDKMDIGTLVDLEKFIDIRFADAACDKSVRGKYSSVIHDPSEIIWKIFNRDKPGDE